MQQSQAFFNYFTNILNCLLKNKHFSPENSQFFSIFWKENPIFYTKTNARMLTIALILNLPPNIYSFDFFEKNAKFLDKRTKNMDFVL